jgi:hypothetical protein
MDTPLTTTLRENDDGPIEGGDTTLVPLPVDGLREFTLPFALAGFGRATEAKHRAWLAIFLALVNTCCHYIIAEGVSSLPKMSGEFWPVYIVFGCTGCLTVAVVHRVWAALEFGADGRPGHDTFIGGLLRAEVTKSTAAALRRSPTTRDFVSVPRAKRFPAIQAIFGIMLMAALGYGIHAHRGLQDWELAMLAIAVPTAALWIPCIFNISQPLLEVLSAAAADQVRQITLAVKATTASTADYGSLIRDISKADETISKLGDLGGWLCAQVMAAHGQGALACASIGFGPASPPGHWWTTWHMAEVCVGLTFCNVLVGIWSLTRLAKITSECQALADAINRLRRVEGPGGANDISMASTDELMKIEALVSYVKGMNRGQGMGFAIKRKRITFTLVLDIAVTVASVMAVAFPMMLGVIEVEGEDALLEGELLNSTAAGCCACA